MSSTKRWLPLLASLAVSLLVACSSATPGTDSNEEAGESTDVEIAAEAAAPETVDEETTDSGEIVTLYVGPETVDCEGEGPQTCLQVTEDPDQPYQLFYDGIAGFTYEPGYVYEIDVLVEPVANPPAGGSSLKYTLVEEVSKVPVEETEAETGEAAASADTLSGTRWQLDSYTGAAGAIVEPLAGTEITLEFQDGQFSGDSSCNSYFGAYEVNGNDIMFGPIAATEMACAPEISQQESGYLTALGQATSFSGDDNSLTLMNENGDVILTYSVRQSTSLTGTTWQAIGYNNGRGGVTSLVAGTEITALFDEAGTLSGSAGCNSYNTTYTVDGNNISISEQMAVTRRACQPEPAEQEMAYLAALPQAATYTIDGDRLQLRDADGSLLADYHALPEVALTDTVWVASSYHTGGQAVVSVINGTRLTAEFMTDGSMAGAAGCNNYFGAYTVDGSNISIGPLGSTQMACPENIMQQEFAYLNALQSAATYRIDGDFLQLLQADGTVAATFLAEPPQLLAGTAWDVLSYNNGNQAVVSVIIGTEMTADFGEDGTLSGSAGCNNYSAGYEADEENIQIGPAATTRMLCNEPEGIMEQENQYLAALQTAAVYRIDGHLLEMRTADGARAATFRQSGFVDPEVTQFLEQATYMLDLATSGEVTLENGSYSEPIVEGSATELQVQLTEHVATGQIDGQPAVASVIVADPGGSGTFYYLALFTATDDGLQNTSTVLLGDRVQINSTSIKNDQITVDMVQSGPDDPLCCPTQHVINTYELQDGQLTLIASDEIPES